MFISYFLIFGLIFGGVMIGIPLACGMDRWWKRILAWLLSVAICGFALGSSAYKSKQNAVDVWNNGVCDNCCGTYEFVNASRGRHKTFYYYQCDTCGQILESTIAFH